MKPLIFGTPWESIWKPFLEASSPNSEFGREDFEEISNYKWNQLTQDPNKETFAEFLKTLKKTAKQAFGDKASEFVETFMFGKLPTYIFITWTSDKVEEKVSWVSES